MICVNLSLLLLAQCSLHTQDHFINNTHTDRLSIKTSYIVYGPGLILAFRYSAIPPADSCWHFRSLLHAGDIESHSKRSSFISKSILKDWLVDRSEINSRYYWDDITVTRHFVSYVERDLSSRTTSVPVTNMKSTLTLKLLPPDSDSFKANAGKGLMGALAAYCYHYIYCMDGIKAIDDEDEEVHHHERAKFMEDDEAFRQRTRECLAPRPSRFLFFEFRQELFEGWVGKAWIGFDVYVGQDGHHWILHLELPCEI
ncbi:hypothetical protein EDD22DRAFT_852165 [Suillus occidentalis]|nr:hypothetical protein EDD22DRAFT_852165 [Suillus occidentalis]